MDARCTNDRHRHRPIVARATVIGYNAPGLIALKGDLDLARLCINLDFGRIHNKNKNPVADKGILELTSELLRFSPEGGSVSESDLAYVTNVLNSRIRRRGLSAWEILFQRDSDTLKQLDFDDSLLAKAQVDRRLVDQSDAHRTGSKETAKAADVHSGSLVFIKDDGDKTRSRERFLVTKVDGNICTVVRGDFGQGGVLGRFAQRNLKSFHLPSDGAEFLVIKPASSSFFNANFSFNLFCDWSSMDRHLYRNYIWF